MAFSLSIQQALRKGAAALETSGVAHARLTAEVLLSHAVGKERSFLYGHPEYLLTAGEQKRWLESLARRRGGTPTQYITGHQEFFGLDFQVTPAVLIPRPETELLVEEAVARAPAGGAVLDIGTGSGCIAIAFERQRADCRVFAVDISSDALAVARQNAQRLAAAVQFARMDLSDAVGAQRMDVVVCNPPYVPLQEAGTLPGELRFEPHEALFGGEQGLDVYRRAVVSVWRVLRPGGWLLFELGYNTRSAVEQLLAPCAWEPPLVRKDLAGIDRMLAARKH